MKKSTVFILFLLLFPIISAVEFDMKTSFIQGETLTAKVSGNFLTSITKNNVFFYRGHERSAMEYDVLKIEDEFYIYALLSGKSPDNYSISIENVKYMRGAEITGDYIIKNFSITNNTADFSVRPGVIVASEDFFVEIQNLQDRKLTVNVNTGTNTTQNNSREILISSSNSKEASVILKSGEIKRINFNLTKGEPGLQNIELKTDKLTYEILVYISEGIKKNEEKSFKFNPSSLVSSIPVNSISKKVFYLYNTGDKELNNISLSLSDSLGLFANLSQKKIDKLDAKSNISIELSFFYAGETEIDGDLEAKTENLTASSFISLKFSANFTKLNETGQSSSPKTCAESNGTIYNTKTEKCSLEHFQAKDGWCCPGNVAKIEKSSTGRIIAIVLILLIVGGLVWFYFAKYRKTKKPINLLKIAKGKKDN